jgi:hypothetical protein
MNNAQTQKLDRIIADLESLRDELQTDFDERSERWQEGERGQALRQIDRIEAAIVELESAPDP